MDIFITGDSFCADKSGGWPFILQNSLPNCNIKLYGEVGSSLFYSYQNLLKHQNTDYDFYIVLVTNPGRLYSDRSPHFSNIYSAENKILSLDKATDAALINRCRATVDYYQYIRNDEFDLFVHDQLLKEIGNILKNKKFILFPCFASSNVDAPFTMIDILLKGFKPFGNRSNFFHEVYKNYTETKNLINHTSVENQEILARYFKDCITNGSSDINIKNFKSYDKPFDYYYEKIKK